MHQLTWSHIKNNLKEELQTLKALSILPPHLIIITAEANSNETGEGTLNQVENLAIVPSVEEEVIAGTQVARIVLNAKYVRKQDT